MPMSCTTPVSCKSLVYIAVGRSVMLTQLPATWPGVSPFFQTESRCLRSQSSTASAAAPAQTYAV